MPELPEVETVCRQLDSIVVGKTIRTITSLHPKTVSGAPLSSQGKTITEVRRIGKMIIMDLDNGIHIAVHLKMSGQLLLRKEKKSGRKTKDPYHKHTRAVIEFTDGDALIFNDMRVFGWVKILTKAELKTLPYVKSIGPEPWDITDEELYRRLKRKNCAVKLAILDQTLISGVGNIYANDGLWMSHIRPSRQASTLSKKEAFHLRIALVAVLIEGIKHGGSTGQDGKYVHVNGESGKYQNYFKVYDKKGEPCQRNDGGIIEKVQLGGRGTYFCPVCQP